MVAALALAERLGGETVILRAEGDPAAELIGAARRQNVTRLIVGRRVPSGWRGRLVSRIRPPVSERLLDLGSEFEITVLTADAGRVRPMAALRSARPA